MDLNETARRILAAKGINPDTQPASKPFDPKTWLTDRVNEEFAASLPARFIAAETDHPQVQAWVTKYLTNPRDAPSLLLLGNTGTGKTHQAIGALRAAVLGIARTGRRLSWKFSTHPDLNAGLRPTKDDRHLHVFEQCLRVDLLVIDELGAGMVREWSDDTIQRIINSRWSNCQPTICTSNLPPRPAADDPQRPNLLTAVGDRVVSRLADGVVVRMIGADRRRTGGAG